MKKQILVLLLVAPLCQKVQASQLQSRYAGHPTRKDFLQKKEAACTQAIQKLNKPISPTAKLLLMDASSKIENDLVQTHLKLAQNPENTDLLVYLSKLRTQYSDLWGIPSSVHYQAHLETLLLQKALVETTLKHAQQ